MKKALIFAAISEAATGLALLVVPSLVAQLLFGQDLVGVSIPVARVTGIALIGLGIALWPGSALLGMLVYSTAVALYLAFVGLVGGFAGFLLWPAVILHAVLSVVLGRIWLAGAHQVMSQKQSTGIDLQRLAPPGHESTSIPRPLSAACRKYPDNKTA